MRRFEFRDKVLVIIKCTEAYGGFVAEGTG